MDQVAGQAWVTTQEAGHGSRAGAWPFDTAGPGR